jgi:hypothetical protein
LISRAAIGILCGCYCLAFVLTEAPLIASYAFVQGREAEKADDGMAAALRRLESSDPGADVTAAIGRGDLRFIGIAGYTVTVPGVLNVTGQPSDKDNERLVARQGVRVLEGTSDDKAALAFQLAAIRYAERYNTLLLQHLKQNR